MKIVDFCPKCHGTGNMPAWQPQTTCNRCGGDGEIEIGFLNTAALEADIAKVLRRLKKIMDKLDIGDD